MSDEGSNGNGHGSADPGADVLPFRAPADGRGRRRGSDDTEPDEQGAEHGEPSLAAHVTRLAAKGLDEEEIRVRLSLPDEADAESERVLAAAFRRGQVLGRAYLKEAQFEAAVQGRVTAQAQVLARLGEPAGEDGGEMEAAEAHGLLPPAD